ncbi:MAG: ATP-binding protein [bacterium]
MHPSPVRPPADSTTYRRERAFRHVWFSLAALAAALYLGWGGFLPWGLLPALLLWPLAAGGKDPAVRAVGPAGWLTAAAAAAAVAGTFLLPLHPSDDLLARTDARDRQRLSEAVEESARVLGRAAEGIAEVLQAPALRERGAGDLLTSAWREQAGRQVGEAAAVALFENGRLAAWAGSPYLVAGEEGGAGGFVVGGDSLAVRGTRTLQTPRGTVVVTGLLFRSPGTPGPAPDARPLLEELLPDRLARRVRAVPPPGGGEPVLTVAPWTPETMPYPGRRTAQLLLLLLGLASVLALLLRDDALSRGWAAAPLLYVFSLPLVAGKAARPLEIGLIAPSWSGYGLTNQAFVAVAAAGVGLWFADVRRRSSRGEEDLLRRLPPLLLLPGMLLIWGLGLALLQDLYRFAPTWFWVRVSFLPGGRDLVGWLIAVALTLAVLGLTGGLGLVVVRRWGLRGRLAAGGAALTGGALAGGLGVWSGGVPAGGLIALAGQLGSTWLLERSPRAPALPVLMGMALLGAGVQLPVRWQLGSVLTRDTVERAASSLSTGGVGLDNSSLERLRGELRRKVGPAIESLGSEKGEGDRLAYLLWEGFRIPPGETAGGVQMVDRRGRVSGSFETVPDLFLHGSLDSLRQRVARGRGQLLLLGGAPASFGEETLVAAVPGGEGGVLAAVRRRPLAFLAVGEERLWVLPDAGGSAERSGRLAGSLYVRTFDEAYRLLSQPVNPALAPASVSVPPEVVDRLRGEGEGVWHRRGGWTGGAVEYYFRLRAPSVHPPVPGSAVTAEGRAERRVASLGMVRPGLWGRVVETLHLLVLFAGTVLLLAWLPALLLSGRGLSLRRRLSRVSFRTRLLIPLLVVSLVPMVALWLLTRAFALNRETANWEEGLDRSLRDTSRQLLDSTERWAAELAREAERGTRYPREEQIPGAQWAVYDPGIARVAGTLTDTLADRIPVREAVMGRGPASFMVLTGSDLWSVAVVPVGAGYARGAALAARPVDRALLRDAVGGVPWQADLFLDGQLRLSTESAPYTAGILPPVLPPEADLVTSRGREAGGFEWGEARGMRYLRAWRPLTDYTGMPVAAVSQRRFGLWGLNDPELSRLFSTVASVYLLLVAAVTVVALLVARRISRPIGALTASAIRVSGGDLDTSIPVTRGDEVGGLQKAFRQMVIALRESRDRIAQAERERAWQEMARQVAHEIKNPLTPMQLNAQFLRRAWDEDAEDLDRILREATDSIVEQVEELRRIANEFSTYARLPSVRREPVDLNTPLQEAISLFAPTLPDGVEVVRDLDPLLPEVPLDAEQIRRVAINLIRNALDAMGEEGTLTVRTGQDAEGVWLQVSDTGEGIAAEVQERLFEPYFSTKTDGTGLGLAITRAVVDAHGGTVEVDSRPGRGTSFTAHFPAAGGRG